MSSKDYSPKPIKELMQHLSSEKGIVVTSENTRQLLNYGYYHAYKGYRFFKNPNSLIPYTFFEQIIAVIDYDNDLKASFYSPLMFLETALKNIIVASVIEGLKTANFETVLKNKMSDDEQNKVLYQKRRRLKDKIYTTLQKRYRENNPIISHFFKKGDDTPIWALFEIISLSDFANFNYCLNYNVRASILRDLGIKINEDKENQLLANILYTLKDLRNALAHNNVIFDTRFRVKEPNNNVIIWLNRELNLNSVDFNSITDYYLLIGVLMNKIEYEDKKIERFLNEFSSCIDNLYRSVPQNIYQKLTTTQYINKRDALKSYLDKN